MAILHDPVFNKWFAFQSNEAFITPGNKEFIAEVLGDQYDASGLIKAVPSNTKCDDANQLIDIKDKVVESEFKPSVRRCGVIARKIGFLRMWRNDGKRITATGLQIDDNHVISYHDPGEYDPVRMPNVKNFKKMGTVLVGAGSVNPYLLTKEYCGLFKDSGVMPKKILSRFFVSPAAKLPPGIYFESISFHAPTMQPFVTVSTVFSFIFFFSYSVACITFQSRGFR